MRRMYGLFTYMKGEQITTFKGNGWVNIPYMEHVGFEFSTRSGIQDMVPWNDQVGNS